MFGLMNAYFTEIKEKITYFDYRLSIKSLTFLAPKKENTIICYL